MTLRLRGKKIIDLKEIKNENSNNKLGKFFDKIPINRNACTSSHLLRDD
jgi:hypothetical protein